MKYPNSPRLPRQKYLLTVKGLAVYMMDATNKNGRDRLVSRVTANKKSARGERFNYRM